MREALWFSRTRLKSHVSTTFSNWKALYHNSLKHIFFKTEETHIIAKQIQTGTIKGIPGKKKKKNVHTTL